MKSGLNKVGDAVITAREVLMSLESIILPEKLATMRKTQEGFYSLINDEQTLMGDNLRFVKLYNRIAPLYNISQKLFYKYKLGGEENFRNRFLRKLNIKDNHTVLEVSVGTADNLPFLNKNAQYVGIDISSGMLKMAAKHTKRWRINAELIQCEAESLPFYPNSFDCVYHFGGINFFNDKRKAISEMIRVAKEGSMILISDETDEIVKKYYQKNPLTKSEFTNIPNILNEMLSFVPAEVINIHNELSEDGLIYIITFEKPKSSCLGDRTNSM
jgi:ubiquinone/menaquinone biosynthesis C-methylase UbiE